MAKVKDELLDHNYDGIQEYDNPMPRWWVNLFLITIVWSAIYIYYYHVSGFGESQQQEYDNEIAAATLLMSTNNADFEYQVMTDGASLTDGKALFDKNCASCHGKLGEGGIGPNLTDKFWIHGGSFNNIVNIILEGVPAKSMISWKALLRPEQVQNIASYILTIQGTNPAGAKEAQGEIYEQ